MNRNFNIVFWILIWFILLLVFGKVTGSYRYAFYFLSFFLPVILVTSHVFSEKLIPNYLLKKRYGKFALHLFYLLVISMDLELVIVFLAFIVLTIYDPGNMYQVVQSYKWMPVVMYFIVLIHGFISIVYELINQQKPGEAQSEETVVVRSDRKNRKIKLHEVLYVESMSDYIRIFLKDKQVISTRLKISRFHDLLPDNFLRIHRSFLVNLDYVDSFNREELDVKGNILPLSRTYKREALEKLETSEKV